MKISKIRIENYKSLADTGELSLDQVNVLVGRNNHGKSAFISAVHMLQAGGTIRAGDIRLGQQEVAINVELTINDADDLVHHFTYLNGLGLQEEDLNKAQLNITVSDNALSGEIHLHGKNYRQTASFRQIPAQEPNNFIYTYLSKRKVYGFEREVNLERTRAVQSDLRNLVAKVARLADSDYIHASEYEELCKAMLGFRISVHAAQDGNGQQAGIPVGSFGYIPIESMGEGVSSQLGLITDLCLANGHLFLIEEPENDVHPEALKTLLNVIIKKSETNQFIISTHSNIVTRYLGAAPNSKIFEFESNYRANEIPTSTVHEVGLDPEERIAVLRRLGYELSDFDLWDGWLILEESSAEIIIRYLIPWFVPELSRIRTVAAGGTSKVGPTFEDFRRLFLFAHLEPQYRGRAWVIVDGDDSGEQVISKLRAKYSTWPSDHFSTWSQANFEHYYPSPHFDDQVKEALAKNGREKRAAKKRLLDEVKSWCAANTEEARAEFKDSAAEVIEKLRAISRALSK